MNIINFPGGKKGRGDDGEIERASRLKGRLVDFVTRGPMRERHARAMQEAGLAEPEVHEFIDFTDWFIFEWEGEDGATVLDEFLASQSDLTDVDRRLLERWYDAVDDIFQVVEIAEGGVLLRDGEGEIYFTIPTNMATAELGWRPKTLVQTRILPVGDVYLLSGIQSFYSGPELDDMPDGINLAAFADMIERAAEESEFPFAGEDTPEIVIPDVRELPAERRPEGSVAGAAHAFLAESPKSLKPATAEAHALAVSFLAHFAAERGVARAEVLDENLLLDFLAVWYPPIAPERTLGATRQLLGSVGKFAAWLDRRYATTVGRDFKQRVLPALKDDLPRTLKAADEIDRLGPLFGLSQMIIALAEPGEVPPPAPGRGEPFHGRFAVVAVDGPDVTLRERADDANAVASLVTVEFPRRAADLLRPGDVVEGVLRIAGGHPILETVDCIYCPAAGV